MRGDDDPTKQVFAVDEAVYEDLEQKTDAQLRRMRVTRTIRVAADVAAFIVGSVFASTLRGEPVVILFLFLGLATWGFIRTFLIARGLVLVLREIRSRRYVAGILAARSPAQNPPS